MKEQLESGTIENIGELMHENWRLKTQLSCGITDQQIDNWYHTGILNGAQGGKILGAGNGGFLMFFAPKSNHTQITKALTELQQVKFKFERTGSQIVFYHSNK